MEPDPRARALARGRTGAVGILLTDSLQYAFTDEVAMALMGPVAGELAPTGLALTMLGGSSSATSCRPATSRWTAPSCTPATPPLRGRVAAQAEPADRLHRPGPVAGVPSVNIDDRGGALAAAQHLLDLGHRRIGVVLSVIGSRFGVVDDPLRPPPGPRPARARAG